ncbi:TPA: hypothetical protein KPE15_000154 [Clostridioides difficile]|nr:hypothetical protein [Clostridioides difficile]
MGFRLTIWNVNGPDAVTFLSTCFRLTMWYVNGMELPQMQEFQKNFILTMWYINKQYTS